MLQEAYASEANKIGSWKLIGYVAPGATKAEEEGSTTNFAYKAGNPDVNGEATAISSYGSDKKVWGAANIVALNECADQSSATLDNAHWSISIKANSNGNSVAYTASTDCDQLTPTFENIGK